IYEYDIFPVRRLKDEETDSEMLEISLNLPHDGQRFIRIPNSLLTDPKKLMAALADKGVLVHIKEINSLTSYIIEYAKMIQRESKADEEFARFGWRDIDTDNPRFVLGEYVVNNKGELRKATPANYLKDKKYAVSFKGTLSQWKEGFSIYNKLDNCEPFKFAVIMGFAAPLLSFTPYFGMIYNMLGEGGCGKSTALKIMTSIWGRPDEHHIRKEDNRIPMFNTIGYLQSIPVSFDELTTISADTLNDLTYSISEGRGKDRADRSGNTRVNTVKWKTIICASSNLSMYEKLGMVRSGNNASAYRIFEVQADKADSANAPAINEAVIKLENNYGLAGLEYIKYILKNIKQVKQIVANSSATFARQFNMPTAERFWFNLFGIMSTGGSIARKLGLSEYREDEIVLWGAKQLANVRETINNVEGDPISIFAHFLQTNLRSTLIVKNGASNPLLFENNVISLLVRLEYFDDIPITGFVSIPAIKEYCKYSNIEYGWLLRKLEETSIVLNIENKKLGEGTSMLTGLTKCWVVDLQNSIMQKTS
ncbi:MAG: DUF927 domain-containing protein, partial [Candidatus Dormibacteria bacterium]